MKTIRTKLLFIPVLLFYSAESYAQKQLSEGEAVALALNKSPVLKAADLQVRQSAELRKAAVNIPNPDVMAESPTGEFMTVGVLQSLSFPTVYTKQHQLAKQQVVLAQKAKTLSAAEVSWRVKSAYLNLQVSRALLLQLKTQDSLYQVIATSAKRQFEAGQEDHVTQVYAAAQYGEIHSQYAQAEVDARIAMQQLQLYTGISDSIVTSPVVSDMVLPAVLTADSNTVKLTPSWLYMQQLQFVSQKSLELEHHKALPGLSIGFLNQGPRNTTTDLRIRAGINIPLWFWQYKANIKAARTNVEISGQNLLAQQQIISSQLQQVTGDMLKYWNTLEYYRKTGLQQAEELIVSSGRLFAAGKSDYISYMRTLADASNIKMKYINALKDYKQSVITKKYLQGEQ